jgi:hypothetical protein
MFPPMLLYLRHGDPETAGPGIWLPLFLVWLLLLPIAVLAFVLTMVADVVLFLVGERYHHYTLLLLGCLGLLGAMRGTVVHVRDRENVVDFDLV